MNLIQHLTDQALQTQNLILPDGSTLVMQLYFRDSQHGWFFNSLQNKSFTVNGLRVTNNSNTLRQFKNLIDFGIACYTTGNREPTQQTDFLDGTAKLYLLTKAEVLQYEEFLSSQT